MRQQQPRSKPAKEQSEVRAAHHICRLHGSRQTRKELNCIQHFQATIVSDELPHIVCLSLKPECCMFQHMETSLVLLLHMLPYNHCEQ